MEAAGSWRRPTSVPYPQVWLTCTGKKPLANGKIPKFRIQDATEDMHEDLVGYMCNIFARDEHLCRTMKIADDPVSIKEFEEIWRKFLNFNITVVALLEEDEPSEEKRPRIAGCNILGVTRKTDPKLEPNSVKDEPSEEKRPRIAGCNILGVNRKTDPKLDPNSFKGEAARPVMRFIFDFALKDVDVFEIYGVDEYMSAFGLFVHPDFRGQGLAVPLLKARFPLAKALGIKATMTFFSPIAAHVASEKAGMKLIKEAVYDEYEEDGKVLFPNIPSRVLKVMGAVIT
ncbi:hypothetical protein C0J52_27351 [Blattella germanica]|nr:hypothetical protein C0J52_27351 [Blattella germanica]